jgi:hypothetical protein
MSLNCNSVLPGGACLMGKAFKSGPCTYCGVAGSTTADHVIARGFFPLDLRANLPKVGACQECNHKKSKLEHALTAVMPFGAQHGRAKEALLAVERMLARNKSLHRLITLGFRSVFRSINGSPWVQETTVPFDGGSLELLGEYIVKGLAHHHWGLDLGVDTYVRASFLTAEGAAAFDQFFAGNTEGRVVNDLGEGVFRYEGIQSAKDVNVTLWKMSIYGAEIGGDPLLVGQRASLIYGVSVSKDTRAAELLSTIFGDGELAARRCVSH